MNLLLCDGCGAIQAKSGPLPVGWCPRWSYDGAKGGSRRVAARQGRMIHLCPACAAAEGRPESAERSDAAPRSLSVVTLGHAFTLEVTAGADEGPDAA